MTYVVYKQALSSSHIDYMANITTNQFQASPNNDIVQRKTQYRYPGIELSLNDTVIYDIASKYVDKFCSFTNQQPMYDNGPGTDATFVNATVGEGIAMHVDRPIYQLDDNFNILPEYVDRFCSKTVVMCLSSDYVGGDIDVQVSEREIETVHLLSGDVLVMESLTPHALTPISSGQFMAVCYFMCGNITPP